MNAALRKTLLNIFLIVGVITVLTFISGILERRPKLSVHLQWPATFSAFDSSMLVKIDGLRNDVVKTSYQEVSHGSEILHLQMYSIEDAKGQPIGAVACVVDEYAEGHIMVSIGTYLPFNEEKKESADYRIVSRNERDAWKTFTVLKTDERESALTNGTKP